MDSNYDDQLRNEVQGIRKDASVKTALSNKIAFKKIKWNKVQGENESARKGILADAGLVVINREGFRLIPAWDLREYTFLLDSTIPFTVNPKLWIHGRLNLNAGLFQVTDRIFQIRGFDLGNMSFVRGERGWIVIDCLTTKETASAAMQFINSYFGEIPVSAVIITHSHVDHYGGIDGVKDYFIDKDVRIYVPNNFADSVIEENVTAGVAMSRRSLYQYGILLPHDGKGQIDVGIGKGLSVGTVTFTGNVYEVKELYERKEVDGVEMEFLLALGTEAPAEMFIYIPGENSLCIAEDANATMHNLYTLRGAKVRDAVAWAKSIQNAIDLWGEQLTTVFGVHNWPRFGRMESLDYLEMQRDLYQYINDQTLRYINQGYTLDDVGHMVKLPEVLEGEWYNSQFYGTVNHNAKAVYQRYLGWYNSNPVDLNRLPMKDSSKRYVEYMGGEECVLARARESFEQGEYQWVAEITKQLIFANPNNREAKLLCADALEQLGYIQEAGTWRNEYLKGAQELRFGVIKPGNELISTEVLDNLPFSSILNLLSIRMKGVEAGRYDYKLNFIIPDRNDTAATQVKRGIFRYLSDKLASNAEVTITMPKEILYRMVTTNDSIENARIGIEGDIYKWYSFLRLIDTIDLDFPIMTPVQS